MVSCTAILVACSPQRGSLKKDFIKDLSTLIDTSANERNIGILLHVESPDHDISWSGAAGYSDFEKQIKLREDQCFRIASVTKTFVAGSILRLWEEGKLSLYDPVSKYISKEHYEILKRGSYDPDKITVNHLLTHTGGLFDHTNAREFFEKVNADPSHVWTRTEQLEGLVNWAKPVGIPGERFSYSDSGYILLGEILENITGKTMYDAFTELLDFKKLGLTNTTIEDAVNPDSNPPCRIHQYTEGKDTYSWNCSIDLYGGGGLLSTTRDLSIFYRALFHNKVFKNVATLDTMLVKTTCLSPEKPRIDYRKGIFLVTLNNMNAWTHTGYWGTQVAYIPELDLTMATNYSMRWQKRGQAPVLEYVAALFGKKFGKK
jgi:D-alanyl-D-alanine carboxypeptidase